MRRDQQRSSFASNKAKKNLGNGISPGLFYSIFGVLALSNVITLVAFLMSGDIVALLDDRADTLRYAYQDRIVQLRQEVDRLHSRQYAQAGNLNLQLQELSYQQEVLTEQHEYVKTLAKRARDLGITTADAQPKIEAPVAATLVTGAITPRSELPDLEYVSQSLEGMMASNRQVLGTLSKAAAQSTNEIVAALDNIGIKSKLPDTATSGVGGPYEPLPDHRQDFSLIDEANAAMTALERFAAARTLITKAPIHRPVAEKTRISSTFGARRDPFTKGSAFHAGMDFAAPRGTPVKSAGDGEVIHAGRRSGYGNLVEIRHTTGLVTRYAHLSKFNVKTGQKVRAGQIIAQVGSTGRSTGPHLHFEVRRNDEPVNPSRYLRTGNALAKFL